jgi:hypothetical protein
VVRAGHVVAERRGGAASDEQATGIAHARGERLGLLAHQLEMLGRDLLGKPQRGDDVVGLHELGLRLRSVRPAPNLRGHGVQQRAVR